MSTYQGQPLILSIGSNGDFLHIYQNEDELVADKAVGPGSGQFSGPVEFFDSDGHRFAGVYDKKRNLRGLTPTADSPDLPDLLQRLQKPFDRVQSFIEDNPEEFVEFGMELLAALLRLPCLSTSADLREFLQVFVSDPVFVAEPVGNTLLNPGSPGHNALHQAGLA